MGSSFGGLGIGISGLFAQQRALDVTGHNISNVNTPGYSRQIVNHASSLPDNLSVNRAGTKMQAGTGVDVSEIRQYRDEFLDTKLRKENSNLGYWSTKLEGSEEVQSIFNDNTEQGLQTVMNNFWNSWEQLSKPTGGLTARALVKENAVAFIETVKNMDQVLTNYRKNKDTEIVENIGKLNNVAKQIASLNYKIKDIENHGTPANDIRDQRNILLDQISQMAHVQIHDQGVVSVALEGKLIVEDSNYTEIQTVPDAADNGYVKLVWKDTQGKLDISGGSLKGLFETRDTLVFGFRERLNQFVSGIATEVNKLHISGYGTNGTAQYNLFVSKVQTDPETLDTNVNLSNIMFNDKLNDFNKIAAAQNPDNNEDNRIALAISSLRTKSTYGDTGYVPDAAATVDPKLRKFNFDEYYRNIITDLGNVGNEALTASKAQKLLIDQVENRRQTLSAVSLDEEMSNLIRYEHSYNASSRVVNAMDEMLEVIVNKLTGGR